MGNECQLAFPTFDDKEMASVLALGELVKFPPDTVLIEQGQKDYPFYVIRSGQVRIVEKQCSGEYVIAVHRSGEFTGDVDMLTGRSAIFRAVTEGPVEAVRLCGNRLRKLLNACPSISDKLLDAFQVRRQLLAGSGFRGICIIGNHHHSETGRLREFLYKNHVPHSYFVAEELEGQSLLRELNRVTAELPVVHCNGHTLSNPPLSQLAECIGISRHVDGEAFDLVIVGSGPAGLAAAVYAASEGIRTLVVDRIGPGGQAGSSSKIENFLGYPSGISGGDLANRGYLQALKFGAQFIAPATVEKIDKLESGEHAVHLCTQQVVRAPCILVASGVTYRQLGVTDPERYELAGIYYAATSVEARICENSTAVVVGGGNSAGQAAMYLAGTANAVKLVLRGGDLSKNMSAYLCSRILDHPKIEVLKHSQVISIEGAGRIESIQIACREQGSPYSIPCHALFCFIGAEPHTRWLPDTLAVDDKGYILTGAAIPATQLQEYWPIGRSPCDLETSIPGILAAGDVRAGSTKRCGFAIGDGSLAVSCAHRILAARH